MISGARGESAFALAGGISIALAGVAGAQALRDAAQRVSARSALAVCMALLLAGALLLLCHWRWTHSRQISLSATEYKSDQSALGAMEVGIVVAITLLGAVLRLIALRHSLWYDELWTVNFMRSGPVYAVTHQAGYNNHLLNSLLGSLLVEAGKTLEGGKALPADTLFTLVRLPALLFGIASIPLLYFTLRSYVDRPVAAIAALLLALSPVTVDLSAQTRGYSSVIYFTILQAMAFGSALRRRASLDWVMWLVWATLGALAHLYLIFPVMIDGLWLLILAGRRAIRSRDWKGALALLELPALLMAVWALLVVVCYAGVLGVVREQLRLQAGTPPMARAHEVLAPLLQGWGGAPERNAKLGFYAACATLFVAGLWHFYRRAPALGLYLALLLVVPPILVEIAKPHFVYMRFFAFALPAVAAWFAAGLWQIARSLVQCQSRCYAMLVGQASVPVEVGQASVPVPPISDRQAGMPALLLNKMSLERALGRKTGEIGAIAVVSALTASYIALTLPGLSQVLRLPKQDYKHTAAMLLRAQRSGMAIAAVGAGCEYLKSYGVSAYNPRSLDQLLAFVRQHGTALVADTDLTVNIHSRVPTPTRFLRRYGGPPIAVFPGRYAAWSVRWLDGDSDFKVYRLSADKLPPGTLAAD